MKLKEIIQNNLLFLRKQKNLSSERVAQVLNLSRQAYSSYENGTREISVESLKILANFYGVSLDLITSSSLLDAVQPSICFSTITYQDYELKFSDYPVSITNLNSSLIIVKLSEHKIKVFETNIKNVLDHEMLFEFEQKLYIAKVYFFESGDGVFINNGSPVHFTKTQSKSLIFLGMLLATVNKEYDYEYFL